MVNNLQREGSDEANDIRFDGRVLVHDGVALRVDNLIVLHLVPVVRQGNHGEVHVYLLKTENIRVDTQIIL